MLKKRESIMNPDLVKNDLQVASAMETWEDKCRTTIETQGEEKLPQNTIGQQG